MEQHPVIRQALKARKMTQKELAQELRCSEPLVSHWIRGSVKPTLKHAFALERVLGIPAETWIDGRSEDSTAESQSEAAA